MRNRGIMIELTALLDVILIMMFVILVQGRGQVQEAQIVAQQKEDELKSVTVEYEKLKEEKERFDRYVIADDLLQKNSYLTILSMQISSEKRFIRIEFEDDEGVEIELNWDNKNYASNALKSELKKRFASSEGAVKFIVFQYDRNTIYQADYKLIQAAMQALKENPDVYIAEYDIKGTDSYERKEF